MSICWCRVFLYHFDATEHGEVKLLSAGSIQHVLVCFSIGDAVSRQCGFVSLRSAWKWHYSQISKEEAV